MKTDEKATKSKKDLGMASCNVGDKRKKAIPVRKLLEMERKNLEASVVNDENDLSDANRSHSILGSLERLVESSFRSNNGAAAAAAAAVDLVVARRMMIAKRAMEDLEEIEPNEKKSKVDDDDEPPRGGLNPDNLSAEMKFLKYSELAKELSSNR